MLTIPKVGFARSVESNNIDRFVLSDWIESSLHFGDHELSKSDIVDILGEQEICENQDLAHEIADLGWEEMRRRKRCASIPDFLNIERGRISNTLDWRDDPILSLFLVLTLLRIYPGSDWTKASREVPAQGSLFERAVEAICPNMFPTWIVYRTGWSPDTPCSLSDVVRDLCELMNYAGATDLDDWSQKLAKDGGLDVVCFKDFLDDREALPAYFLQCASGNDWRQKIDTPNANLWSKWLNSALRPGTGIAAPFVIDDKTLRISSLEGQVIILDRLRLLRSFYSDVSAASQELKDDLVEWLEPRVDSLPRIS